MKEILIKALEQTFGDINNPNINQLTPDSMQELINVLLQQFRTLRTDLTSKNREVAKNAHFSLLQLKEILEKFTAGIIKASGMSFDQLKQIRIDQIEKPMRNILENANIQFNELSSEPIMSKQNTMNSKSKKIKIKG